jgi:CRP-like cAMP-binding protein
MPRSRIAIEGSDLQPQFLDGLAPVQRKTVLGAATKRRFCASAVATNQGNPADHLFLLTKGFARCFIITEEGRKLLLQWLGPGDLFGTRAVLSIHCAYLFSTETVTDTSVFVWDRPTIQDLIGRYPRLLENGLLLLRALNW